MRTYPALELSWGTTLPDAARLEHLLAELDGLSPVAVEEHGASLRVFFATIAARDQARGVVETFDDSVKSTAILVPDDGWAERSQRDLGPVRVGRLIVAPPWIEKAATDKTRDDTLPIVIRIQPSMGFGTGHHPSTRLCLDLLQRRYLERQSVLDVGTGSGVLALAAWRLGAARVVAVDCDPDALASASENVTRNGADDAITLRELDVSTGADMLGRFDLVLANLTGAMLGRQATPLAERLAPDGAIIASGFQTDEEAAVVAALAAAGLAVTDRAVEQEWVAVRAARVEHREPT